MAQVAKIACNSSKLYILKHAEAKFHIGASDFAAQYLIEASCYSRSSNYFYMPLTLLDMTTQSRSRSGS